MSKPFDPVRVLLGACCLLALAAQPRFAAASQAAGWWGGNWKCDIDGRSAWVRLGEARNTSMNGLYFRHADGNQWYLAAPAQGKATGWTTWNRKKYKLVCWQ